MHFPLYIYYCIISYSIGCCNKYISHGWDETKLFLSCLIFPLESSPWHTLTSTFIHTFFYHYLFPFCLSSSSSMLTIWSFHGQSTVNPDTAVLWADKGCSGLDCRLASGHHGQKQVHLRRTQTNTNTQWQNVGRSWPKKYPHVCQETTSPDNS